MKKIIKFAVVFIALAIITCLAPLNIHTAYADDQDLFTQSSSYVPNVLIILDTSQSMDEDFVGNVVCPWATGSRLVEAKRQLQAIANKYANSMRIGLMTYQLPGVANYHVHNALYFASYDPKSYCPNPPPECDTYCLTNDVTAEATCQSTCAAQNASFDATYRDSIITDNAVGSARRNLYCDLVYPKKNSIPNPVDLANYIYYKLPGTNYDPSNQGTQYLYASGSSWGNSYWGYSSKTGTSDDTPAGADPGNYSGYIWNPTFGPTDEDTALGFDYFGQRMMWYHVGRTWYANTSPGPGYLQVPVATNLADNVQLNALLAKLAMKEGDEAGYMSCGSGNTCPYIVNAGLTPIAGTLQTAIDYFKGNLGYSSPIQDSCQKNFVIFVTDGLPSVDATGTNGTAASLMPAVINQIDKLRALQKQIGSTSYTFNILTYVVGMALTSDAKPYLDNMAIHGGTAVGGQALYADNAASIYTQLDNAMSNIISRSYSFSTSSISASRTVDENFIYEATFEPVYTSPFWKGYLKKWSLVADGSLNQVVWDAGAMLQSTSAGDRNIKTLIGGSLVNFKSSDIDTSTPVSYTHMQYAADTTSNVVVTNQATADKVIKYIRGYATDPADGSPLNPDNWKLGDIFHSNPITLGTPSLYYHDIIDTNNAFEAYRSAHPRSSADGTRMVIAGANDGQFHAFKTSTGVEFWSFVPPNLLPKLQDIYHTSIPSNLTHNFYVDGPITATDAWLPSSWSDGSAKYSGDWKTLVMFSLGKNDRDYSTTDKSAVRQSTKYWSSSVSCDTGIQETWDATHVNYCGYYAFDFTYAPGSDPTFKWTLKPTATYASYLGEPWSAISTGRVRINGKEVWIGVIGGGYNAALASTDLRGKGILVFDLRDGTPIWSFTYSDNGNMNYSVPSQVALVDSDKDDFIDRAYFGDIKGNVWQLKFCTKADLTSNPNCGTSSWKGSLLLDNIPSSDNFPIYYPPTMTWDRNGDFWIYWASGDKIDPTGGGPAAWVYGLKPLLCKDINGNPSPCSRSNLSNITSAQSAYCGNEATAAGWAINLAGQSEQVLAPLTVFNNILYFTSFLPASGSSSLCTETGESYLYAISVDPGTSATNCTVGNGVINLNGDRSISGGVGIGSGPTISYGPNGTPSMYITFSGAGGQEGGTVKSNYAPPAPASLTNMRFWKDRRLE
jgi:type IV pilus assembly protein PilY1